MRRVVTGEMGEVVVNGDLTTAPEGRLDNLCDSMRMFPAAPQDVLQYTVPGTGPVGVRVSTVRDGTPATFDTLVEVRTRCSEANVSDYAPLCFINSDLMPAGEIRAEGGFTAMGGDVVYIVVTGLRGTDRLDGMATDRGPWELSIEAQPATPPEVTSGEVRVVGDDAEVIASGTDADGDAYGFLLSLENDAGDPIEIDLGGVTTTVAALFAEDLSGMTAFADATRLFLNAANRFRRGTPEQPTRARMALFDRFFSLGPEMTVPVRYLDEVGFGAACDAMNVCARPLACDAGTCAATPAQIAVCTGATPITIATPTDTMTTATVSGTIATGAGEHAGSCTDTPGPELVYRLDVPVGGHDLVVNTDLPMTMTADTDTVVYARTDCANPETEFVCSDDIEMGVVRTTSFTRRVVPSGPLYLFVEQWGTADMARPFEMQVGLVPLRMSGQTCDPMQRDNRCIAGRCTGGTCP